MPIFLILIAVLFCTDAFSAAQGSGVALGRTLAGRYGAQGFDSLSSISFTFNVKRSALAVSRTWTWKPKSDEVTFKGIVSGPKESTVTYSRSMVSKDSALKKIDAWFINDQYWLLFPLHLTWDNALVLTENKNIGMPIGNKPATQLIVQFPPAIGYTPEDKFILYVDNNDTIREWSYFHGGKGEKPTVSARWLDYKSFGPLLLSLDRPFANDAGHVWFTNVGIKTIRQP
ncbi:MAG: hypothetical protein PHC61_15285 [Chitinivibrionales bacterium]|nr:hypothetical protein [Chitinivibrionales bacterium]